MEKLQTVNQRIALVIEVIGVAPSKMAKVLKTDFRLLKRIAYGDSKPPFVTIERLSTEYKINLNWLVHGTGKMFTIESPLNEVYSLQKAAIEAKCSHRAIPLLETLEYLKLWLRNAELEALKISGLTEHQEAAARAAPYKYTRRLNIGVKAAIAVNEHETYTINNTLKIW